MSDDGLTVYEGAELTPAGARFWLAMDGWAVDEAAYLLCAIDPRVLNRWAALNGGTVAVRFPDQFDPVHALLSRASEAGALHFPAQPANVIDWAIEKKLSLPAPLIPDGALVRGGRWSHRGASADDPRHDPEEALRLIKAAQMRGAAVVAADSDDEAKAVAAKIEYERERRSKAEAKRIAEGRYFIDEAANAIAQQRGLGEVWALQFRDAMVKAAEIRALTVRDPSTWLPIPTGQRVSLARIVTRADVNAWLDSQQTGYRWEGPQQAEPAPPKPVQRQAAQGAAILAKLTELGFDAQAVPAAPAGKPSPAKQAVRAALGYSADVMNKAWQRLRAAGAIKDA